MQINQSELYDCQKIVPFSIFSWLITTQLGFCNHAIGLMYLISHYYMAKTKVIPDDLVCTSLPQQWHKPRGKKYLPSH